MSMMALRWVFLTAIISLTFLTGCSEAKYSHAFNAERNKRSIPVIPAGWIGRPNQWGTSEDWSPVPAIDPTNPKPGHIGKWIAYKKDALESEGDEYYSGETYVCGSVDCPPGHREPERLSIIYFYSAEKEGKLPWRCILHTELFGKDLSLQEAADVLKSWGIQRLGD